MRALLTTIGELAGLATVSTGAWLVYMPAGLIVAGLGVFALSVAAA